MRIVTYTVNKQVFNLTFNFLLYAYKAFISQH